MGAVIRWVFKSPGIPARGGPTESYVKSGAAMPDDPTVSAIRPGEVANIMIEVVKVFASV